MDTLVLLIYSQKLVHFVEVTNTCETNIPDRERIEKLLNQK